MFNITISFDATNQENKNIIESETLFPSPRAYVVVAVVVFGRGIHKKWDLISFFSVITHTCTRHRNNNVKTNKTSKNANRANCEHMIFESEKLQVHRKTKWI